VTSQWADWHVVFFQEKLETSRKARQKLLKNIPGKPET